MNTPKDTLDKIKEKSVTSSEEFSILNLEATYVNKFFIGMQQDGIVKLIFAENSVKNDKISFRKAYVMSLNGLFNLQMMLSDAIHSIQKQQSASIEGATQKEKPMTNKEELN